MPSARYLFIILVSFGHLLSPIIDLEVTPNVGASTTSAVEGGGLRYQYPKVKSFPKPTFTWTKDNIVLREDQRISISAAGNLYIGNMDTPDLALYRSTVRNTVTQTYFNRGPITINFSCEYTDSLWIKIKKMYQPSLLMDNQFTCCWCLLQ